MSKNKKIKKKKKKNSTIAERKAIKIFQICCFNKDFLIALCQQVKLKLKTTSILIHLFYSISDKRYSTSKYNDISKIERKT